MRRLIGLEVSSLLLLFLLVVGCGSDTATRDKPVMTTTMESTPTGMAPEGFDVQGHRGARGLKPENTLPAFEKALDLGVTTLELDLHMTADGVVVVWHDPEIDKNKCGLDPDAAVEAPDPDSLIVQGAKLMISNLTFEQLQTYRCDRNPEPDNYPDQNSEPTVMAGDDYRIVSLSQLFDFVSAYSQSQHKSPEQRKNAEQVQFNIETKRRPDRPKIINDGFDGVNPGPFELSILELVRERGLVDRVVVQSFDHRSLSAIRSVNNDIRLAALTWPGGGLPQPAVLAKAGFNIWSPNLHQVSPDLLAEAHDAGMSVIPWTVNDPDDMRRLIEMGVDGLISDRPDILVNLR
ncbi:MAG: glycerophosphodiester phosphodiesterase [Chloroflexota bacterium]|nr:MAG: glycerophosphodiester phosphodiesterase [Chloroflexota bacterium]